MFRQDAVYFYRSSTSEVAIGGRFTDKRNDPKYSNDVLISRLGIIEFICEDKISLLLEENKSGDLTKLPD